MAAHPETRFVIALLPADDHGQSVPRTMPVGHLSILILVQRLDIKPCPCSVLLSARVRGSATPRLAAAAVPTASQLPAALALRVALVHRSAHGHEGEWAVFYGWWYRPEVIEVMASAGLTALR